jgi:ATP phosphoribosyltransferase
VIVKKYSLTRLVIRRVFYFYTIILQHIKSMEKKLRIAIQKSGRLNDESLNVIKECGIIVDNGNDQLKAEARNFPVEILYLRNNDIPQYVEDGVADIAIIGENLLEEKGKDLVVLERLGFSKCRLSMAIPKNEGYKGISYFNGKRIATSYPNSLNYWLKKNNLSADIHEITGSVEIAPNIGLADAICDLVSSGSTLFKNGLKEVAVLLKSEACIVAGKKIDDELKPILEQFLFRVRAVMASRNNKYVLLNAPNEKLPEIEKLLPGMKSPTVMPLVEPGWSSVHSVINENKFWEIIDKLRELGAEGILILPIEKMIL